MNAKTEKGLVLVVDDERDHADGIVESLGRLPVRAMAVYTGEDALQIVRTQSVDVLVTDLKLGTEIDGLVLLDQTKRQDPLTEVVLITAFGTIDTCKQAIRQGAYDYLVKPIDIDQLRTIVSQASQKTAVARSRRVEDAAADKDDFHFDGVSGANPAMEHVLAVAKRVARTNISVLIEGESGTGKELLARAIHRNSPRRHKAFQPVNCAGLSETLLESELFGHVRGAFTGAASDRKGLFEAADKGTLFLDEIGDMPLVMQAKLLRVLEDGIVVPVGSTRPVVVDVRVISATHQDFQTLIAEKRFREDLFFRIKGVSLCLPALRQRPEDIPPMTGHFIAETAAQIGSQVTGITEPAQMILNAYAWPGNIRQLRNVVRTMVVLCDRHQLDVQDIPPEIAKRPRLVSGPQSPPAVSLNEMEKQAIVETLAKTDGNREKTARILGIGERTLYRKIKEYNL